MGDARKLAENAQTVYLVDKGTVKTHLLCPYVSCEHATTTTDIGNEREGEDDRNLQSASVDPHDVTMVDQTMARSIPETPKPLESRMSS